VQKVWNYLNLRSTEFDVRYLSFSIKLTLLSSMAYLTYIGRPADGIGNRPASYFMQFVSTNL